MKMWIGIIRYFLGLNRYFSVNPPVRYKMAATLKFLRMSSGGSSQIIISGNFTCSLKPKKDEILFWHNT